jgi:hypothetical protein
MTLDQIRQYINYICVKENSGGTLTPEQVNIIFPAANIDMFNKKIEKAKIFAIQNKMTLSEALSSIIELRNFYTFTGNMSITDHFINLDNLDPPYAYFSGLTTLYNGVTRKIDLIQDSEWVDRMTNVLLPPIDEYPICRLFQNELFILPEDINSVIFYYYFRPATPAYDYYIDANFNEVYLASGSNYILKSGEIGSNGQTSGTVHSNTNELEWDQVFHIEFCNEVLSRVGINLKDGMVEQYINQAKQEQG